MADIQSKEEKEATSPSSPGETTEQGLTEVSSTPLVKPRKAARKRTIKPQRRGRKSKVSAAVQLSIVQSALARLPEKGIDVFVRNSAEGIVVTITKCNIEGNLFVIRPKGK